MQKSAANTNKRIHPWLWVPSLYFVEGIPYIIVTSIALIMYKRFGLSDTECAFYTAWLSSPWIFKPLWSPFVEIFKTKRWWIIAMQALIGVSLAAIAFTLPTSFFFQCTLAFFWLMAFSSATHDIAADGFYMLALDEHEQALNVGVRSTFYRLALIFGEGLLLILIGLLEVYTRKPVIAWSWGIAAVAVVFLLVMFYHHLVLPYPDHDRSFSDHDITLREGLRQFLDTFLSFLRKPQAVTAIVFLLLYRLPEALLIKITPLFLSERMSHGGLGLTTSELGIVKGTVGTIGLILGGIIGGIVVARDGFRRWMLPMVMAISLPNCLYILLAYYQPEGLLWINVCVAIEQFGYGFGFTLYMLFMLYFSQGISKTAHYALCTGFMALSMFLPGLAAGWIADTLGYYRSFILVMCLVPVTFIVTYRIKVPADFGRKIAS